ncbi:MAG: hypothetical protein WC683_19815 [bacterium]
MTRLFGVSSFMLMMPMDPPSTGAGGIKTPLVSSTPPAVPASAFEKLEKGLKEASSGIRNLSSAYDLATDGLMGIKSEMEILKRDLGGERDRARNLERILQEERRQSTLLRNTISGNEMEAAKREQRIRELTQRVGALEEIERRMSESSMLAKRSFDEQASKVESLLAVIDEAKAGAVGIFSQVDEASNMVAGAHQAITALHDSLVPLFGADSPVVTKVKEQAAAIGSAAASIDQLRGRKAELADLLRIEGSKAGLIDLRALRKIMPLLDESSFEPTKILSEQILLRLSARLITMFNNIDKEETTRRLNAFLEAASILLVRNDIPGSVNTVYEAISSFVDLRVPAQDCRGLFYQMIRVANMLKAGRNLDNISAIFSEIEFQGWYVSDSEIRARKMMSRYEIDAIEGNTLIEFKTVWFGDMFGKYLAELLANADKGSIALIRDVCDVQNNVGHAGHAAKVANQFIRYKQIMDTGPANSLELHITSYSQVPNKILTALYDFFGRERLKVFWYDNVLGNNPMPLAPKDEALPAEAASKSGPPLVEGEGAPLREEPATDVADADLIAENVVDQEPPAAIVIEGWDGIEDAPVAHETEATSGSRGPHQDRR